jgi:translation initiation factor 2 beta subunit (eIF-2beta)/eIF-5
MLSGEAAFKKVHELVERFVEQFASCKKTGYNETLVRKDFIDPFILSLFYRMTPIAFENDD